MTIAMELPPSLAQRYDLVKELGRETGVEVAVKKVTKIFEKEILAKRALREVKLLKHFNGHENITSLLDIDVADLNDFNEMYLVIDLMEVDLHQIIRSQQPLTDSHYQYFIYQICKGLKYIHSAQVLHRDLKPGNLLVNADCELKICDFGLARGISDSPEQHAGFMTEYVATRWYRAPEIMLSFKSYTKAIDMWSVGCIMAELLGGKPLFKGRDYVDQLNQILAVCGTPDDETLGRIGSERAQTYVRSLARSPKVPFSQIFPDSSPEGFPMLILAIDLMNKLLTFDPAKRISVEEALRHPYLSAYHDEECEPDHDEVFDFSFEATDNMQVMKDLLRQEIMDHKAIKSRYSRTAPLKVDA
ncbi:Mitogen-activated protein kinase [Terramyces sp. JEL0728]|nr:Mitogen-activated protein kinase [Terramyces sp. JEL0728]